MNLVQEMLGLTAAAAPDRGAVIADGSRVTFGQLDSHSDTIAAALRDRGVGRGDRVLVMMDNCTELAISFFGVLKAGAAAVLLDGGTSERRLRYVLGNCGPAAMIAGTEAARTVAAARPGAHSPRAVLWAGPGGPRGPDDAHLADVARAAPRRPPDAGLIDQDLAAIIYTSGTTGEPKGAMLTHRNLTNTTEAITRYLGNTPDDVVCSVLPLAYSYGLCQLLGAVRSGYALLLERSFAFPVDVLARAGAHGTTGLPGLPALFARVLQLEGAGSALPSLRYLTNAAASLPPAHVRGLRGCFPRAQIYSMYGQTECTRATYLDPDLIDANPGSVGRAIPNCEVYVVDDGGRRAAPGATGELVVRGSNVMRGFWNNPAATGEKLRDGAVQGEKVLHTGDLFRTDDDGLLYFVGRTDSILKCRGEKVSPPEIEHVLCELEGVLEAAVLGVDDPIDGQAVKAILVPRDGASLDVRRVARHCRERLESVMVPKFIEIRAALPRTASGKLDRSALREQGAP